MYAARRRAEQDELVLRGLRVHLWRWPGMQPEPLVLLHGFMDTGETFQFLADQLSSRYTLVAPDLRGFGRSDRAREGYWFPQNLADLDALLDVLSPMLPVTLLGHSMGGNIASLYAGARPERIHRFVALECFGLPATSPDMAPLRYREWLGQLQRDIGLVSYASWEAFTAVLAKRQPRVAPDVIQFVARAWAEELPDGRIALRADPNHRRINPTLYRRDEAEACWSAITAPVLWLLAEHSEYLAGVADEVKEARLAQLYRDVRVRMIPGVGHMLHYERPDLVASEIERFLEGVRG
jgi:pimeloyl-ACP methyl ester carboxylesterase